MNQSSVRRNVFIVASFALAFSLVLSIWRHASAKQVEADGATAQHLAQLCSEVGKVDSTVLAQIAQLAPLFTFQPDESKPESSNDRAIFVRRNDMKSMTDDIGQLAGKLDWLKRSMDSITVDEIKGKTASLPELTNACVAAVNSISEPISKLHNELATLRADLRDMQNDLSDYRTRLVEAAKTPYDVAVNDLPMTQIYGNDIAAIGSSAEVLDQSQCNHFYRRVLNETPNQEWLTLSGITLTVSPDLLGLDIIVRTFNSTDDVCETKLIRFSHGENIKLPEGTQRVIALFCKPEVMKNPGNYGRDDNGVRFVGKQLIAVQ